MSFLSGLFGYSCEEGESLVLWWKATMTDDERSIVGKASGEEHWEDVFLRRLRAEGASFFIKEMSDGINYLNSKAQASAGLKILAKLRELHDGKETATQLHFWFSKEAKLHYLLRDNPNNLQLAIQACERQIEIALQVAKEFRKAYPKSGLPSHHGYEQLCVIRQKEGNVQESLRLALQAWEQGWWGGGGNGTNEFRRRIERYCKTMHLNAIDVLSNIKRNDRAGGF